MPLTGPQIDRIHSVLLAAFSRDELRHVVRVCLDADFDALVPDKAFAAQVSELVRWADRKNRTFDLVRCAYEHNQGNAELRALWTEVQGWAVSTPATQTLPARPQTQPTPTETAASPAIGTQPAPAPKVFVSYSWDSPEHRRWVRDLAARLRGDGVDTTLDQWHAVPGDQLPGFMESAIRQSDFVLSVCTPKYRQRSDDRAGGVGYEGDIMTAEVFVGQSQRKFIPILRSGEWREASPSWLRGKYYVDLRGEPYGEEAYQDLLTTLHGLREGPPPAGATAEFSIENAD